MLADQRFGKNLAVVLVVERSNALSTPKSLICVRTLNVTSLLGTPFVFKGFS